MTLKEIENILNSNEDWSIKTNFDDGRRNSQDSEEEICDKINKIFKPNKIKKKNREEHDLYLTDGEDLKVVEPENFTNTISFTKLAKMLNLKGNSNESIFKSYMSKKNKKEIKLIKDYKIIFLNKLTKKFTVCCLTELPNECITVNPSNCIQTKIPKNLIERNDDEKFNLVHGLFIEYINKRILNPAKNWEIVLNG